MLVVCVDRSDGGRSPQQLTTHANTRTQTANTLLMSGWYAHTDLGHSFGDSISSFLQTFLLASTVCVIREGIGNDHTPRL
jgi:hypothetical protein